MRQKKTTLIDGVSVPFVITKTTLSHEPKLLRTSRFVGVRAGIIRLFYTAATKAIEIAEDAFFEKEMDVDDGGVIEQTHYAVFIDTESGHPTLEVQEMPWKPGCGAHYEIVKIQGVPGKNTPTKDHGRNPEKIEATRRLLLEKLGIEDPG